MWAEGEEGAEQEEWEEEEEGEEQGGCPPTGLSRGWTRWGGGNLEDAARWGALRDAPPR